MLTSPGFQSEITKSSFRGRILIALRNGTYVQLPPSSPWLPEFQRFFASNPERRQRLFQEGKAASAPSHPHVCIPEVTSPADARDVQVIGNTILIAGEIPKNGVSGASHAMIWTLDATTGTIASRIDLGTLAADIRHAGCRRASHGLGARPLLHGGSGLSATRLLPY